MACASKPVAEPVNVKWEFLDVPGYELRACLYEKDVEKLREALIRCEGKNK